MKKLNLDDLNKVFESRVRIGIMATLAINDSMNFNDLKSLMEVTDGNLASHLKTLEENEYITVEKGFIGRKTNTRYTLTKLGRISFQEHLRALEQIINKMK